MSIEQQLQMRRNVEQMHQTAVDLDDFLSDIGKKDANLGSKFAPTGSGKRGGVDGDETDEEEEAREIEEAKADLRRLAAEQDAKDAEVMANAGAGKGSSKGGGVTHAQKYGQWERYDADSIVDSMEEREVQTERLRKEVVRLENQRAQAKARKAAAHAAAAAEALKANGNAAFGAARYEEAVGLYTDALGHAPRNAVLYANRALALLKLNAHAEAEEDCDASLLLDPGFVKALLRRAQARHAQENFDEALDDLELALDKEPKNGGARQLMAECRRLKAAAAPKQPPKMHTIKIETLTRDPDNDDDPFVQALTPEPPAAPPPAAPPPPVEGAGASATDVAPAASSTDTSDGAATAAEAKAPPKPATLPKSVAPTADSYGTPATLAEMERAWRSFRSQPSEFATLIRRVEPEKMQSLFKNNLPDEIFAAILAAIDTSFFPELAPRALAVLHAITHAGRFSILTMCLDKKDTKAIESIFGQLEAAKASGGLPPDADLAALRKKYA